jgi:GNAT superfamily N-acetyltransferase
METRPARHEDLPVLHKIFERAVGELYGRHRFEPPKVPREVFVSQHAHMLEHDAERFWVAEHQKEPVAFGSAIVRGDTWFLSALFVEPAHQATGLGKTLLRLAWGDDVPGIRRRLTVVDGFQPVSTGLYSRAGLLPATPLLSLAGRSTEAGRTALQPGEGDDAVLAELDRAAYGFDRAVDHAYWQGGARLTPWLAGDEPVAYSYRWPSGRIGPVAGRTADDAGRALAAELERAAGQHVSLVVPGSARSALSAALAAGLRYSDPPGLILSSGPAVPDSLVPHGYSLF